ncbi:DivIVA domain-containing protein [Geodermatophilus sp. SYSU D00705]
MPITPADIEAQQFRIVFRGYDVEEVDTFLDRLQQACGEPAEAAPDTAPDQPVPAADGERPQDDEAAAARALRTLLRAEQMADQVLADAAAEGERLVAEGRAERERILAEAHAERARAEAELVEHRQRELGVLAVRRAELQSEVDRLDGIEREARTSLREWLQDHLDRVGPGVPVVGAQPPSSIRATGEPRPRAA